MAAGWNPNLQDLLERAAQGDGDSWYSGSWLDQAIGGMGDLGRSAWGGINDLGEQWFGGGPGDFSGQVETARQYSEDTANEYENMIRNPIGYAKQNPSATLAGLAGLAAGAGGVVGPAARLAGRVGDTNLPSRLLREERGGSAGPDPAGRVGEAFDRGTRSPADDLKGDIESRSLDDLNPGRRAVADVLSETSLGGGRQSPTMGPAAAMQLEKAIAARARARAMMTEHDYTGHQTPMNAQGGAGVTAIRQGRKVGGEGNPYQRDPSRAGRESRNRTINERMNNVDEGVDTGRELPSEGVESGGPYAYERIEDDFGRPTATEQLAQGYSGGIRDVVGNPGRRTLEDLFEHETDIGNIDSIRAKGIEARWDKAEGDTPRRLVSARRKGGDSEVPEGRARIIFRSDQTPMERGGLSAVKFREGIRPEDIVDIVQAKKSTLGQLAEDTRRSGRDLDPDFETKPKPSPKPRKSKAKPPTPQVPPAKNTSGPTPQQIAYRKGGGPLR